MRAQAFINDYDLRDVYLKFGTLRVGMVVMSEKKPSIDFSNQRLVRLATIVALTAIIVSLLVALYVGASPGNSAAAAAPMTAFSGGTFEASGAAHVSGSDALLFVDDGRPNDIFLMRDSDRKQAGAIKTIDIATSIIDLEGITTDSSYFYVVGSQSKSKGAGQVGLARFKFDAAGQRAVGTESASGLKKFLVDNVAELRGMENTKYNDGGINVEGIAWDPRNKRLLLGLRSPVIEVMRLSFR